MRKCGSPNTSGNEKNKVIYKSKQNIKMYKAIITVVLAVLCTSLFAEQAEQAEQAHAEQSAAEQKSTLPSPLTLEYVMGLDVNAHPQVAQARGLRDLSRANSLAVESITGMRSSVQGAFRYVEPADSGTTSSVEDHFLQWSVQKRLYDFGRSSHAEEAAQFNEQSSEWNLIAVQKRHRIDIMRRFFDVLLADLLFIRDNENMSVAFVTLDKLRKRRELGQVSDIEILEAEAYYQEIRRQFYTSRSSQRASRNRLANIINRPGELASEVVTPTLENLYQTLPEVEQLQRQALTENPYLKSLQHQVQAAQEALDAARANGRPVIDGEARMADYERPMGNRNTWEVELRLNIPLWTGGSTDALVAKAQAQLLQQRSLLSQAKMDINEQVLETWQQLDHLRVQKEEMSKNSEFRDLDLDRARAYYDLEWKTNLGDSMVKVSDARYRLAEVDYAVAVAKAKLNALLGKEVFPLKEKQSETNPIN